MHSLKASPAGLEGQLCSPHSQDVSRVLSKSRRDSGIYVLDREKEGMRNATHSLRWSLDWELFPIQTVSPGNL